jgi:hypothetical protein
MDIKLNYSTPGAQAFLMLQRFKKITFVIKADSLFFS